MPRPSQTANWESLPRLKHEHRAHQAGYSIVAGIDEAGRGPLAGPVVAACVILPEDVIPLDGVKDSKKLSPPKRRDLFMRIHEYAGDVGVGIVDAPTIDRLNILQSTFLAMQRAVQSLTHSPNYLLIDGNRMPPWVEAGETIVRGETHSLSVAAASIVAKVTRDRIMEDYDPLYPQWGFARHKGYGTSDHLSAIRRYGVCDLHRRTFSPITQLALW